MSKIARNALLVLALAVAAAPLALLSSITPVDQVAMSAPGAPSDSAPLPFDPALPVGLAMAIRVKDTGAIAKKFVRNAQGAAGDYAEGVKQAGGDWEAGARAGAENYKAAVIEAAGRGAFERGGAAAGASKYVNNAASKGASRFAPGVAAAEADFAKGVTPFLDTIKGLTLPPRRPKGDPGNQARSQAVAAALRAKKIGG